MQTVLLLSALPVDCASLSQSDRNKVESVFKTLYTNIANT